MAAKRTQPTASQFYHFAQERRSTNTSTAPVTAPAGASGAPTAKKRPSAAPAAKPQKPTDIREELARRERIRNDDAEQDIVLKRMSLNRLFRFLTIETIAVFVLAFLQGIEAPWDFRLEEWSFKLLVTATIAQITAMLFVAVRYLFPKK